MSKKIRLSKEVLERLAPPTAKARDEYRDSFERGLFLFVTQTGAKTFYLYVKNKGRPVRKKIGRFPDLSVAAARNRARTMKAELALGISVSAQPENQNLKITLKDVMEEYLQVKGEKLKPDTIKGYRNCMNTALKSWLFFPIASIDKHQIICKHRELSEKSGYAMADHVLRIFRAFFEFFKDRYDFDGANPAKTLSANRLWNTAKVKRRQSIISKEDMPKWFDGVLRMDVVKRDYLLFVLFTGLRKNEAALLRWENVNLQNRQFEIVETKNGDPLELPMSEFVFELLTARFQSTESEFVFPSKMSLSRPIFPMHLAASASEITGIKFMLHDLRRTFVTVAEGLDLSPYAIKRLVNHRSGASDVTQGYMVFTIDRLREPTEKIAKRILQWAGKSISVDRVEPDKFTDVALPVFHS